MRELRKSKGFTLVELLVVIAIIGLLASVVIVSVNSARAKARDSRRVSDVKALSSAIELYKDSNSGNAPASTGAIATDLAPLVTANFVGKVPTDPKNTGTFVYTYSNTGSDDTYYIQFQTEQASSLGNATYYCSTSAGVVGQTSGACVEK
jgi:type II secretion system protein G